MIIYFLNAVYPSILLRTDCINYSGNITWLIFLLWGFLRDGKTKVYGNGAKIQKWYHFKRPWANWDTILKASLNWMQKSFNKKPSLDGFFNFISREITQRGSSPCCWTSQQCRRSLQTCALCLLHLWCAMCLSSMKKSSARGDSKYQGFHRFPANKQKLHLPWRATFPVWVSQLSFLYFSSVNQINPHATPH